MAKKEPTAFREMARVVNVTDHEVTFYISGSAGQAPFRYVVPPGGTVEVQPGYCRPRETSSEDKFLPPIIVTRTQGQVVPVDSDEGRAFYAAAGGKAAPAASKPEARGAGR
jgi:hypothetical protein